MATATRQKKFSLYELARQISKSEPVVPFEAKLVAVRNEEELCLKLKLPGLKNGIILNRRLHKDNIPGAMKLSFPVTDVLFPEPSTQTVDAALREVNRLLMSSGWSMKPVTLTKGTLEQEAGANIDRVEELQTVAIVFQVSIPTFRLDSLTSPIPLQAVYTDQQIRIFLEKSYK